MVDMGRKRGTKRVVSKRVVLDGGYWKNLQALTGAVEGSREV